MTPELLTKLALEYPMIGMLSILLVNLIYFPAIWYGVVSDDTTALKINPYNVKRRKTYCVILHILVSIYIYIAFGMNIISLIAAILFSIHPLTIQVSCWGARAYGLNALLFLAILSFPLLTPLYFLTEVGIATTLFTPLIFIFTKHWYISLIFPILLWFSLKGIQANVGGKIKGDGIFTMPLPEDFTLHKFKMINIVIIVKTFGYYSLACLLPIKNGFYNSFLTTFGSSKKATDYWYSFNRHFWGGMFAIVLMAIVWWFNKNNFIGLGIMLFVTSIIPFLNIITVQQFTAPRYAYLPLVGFQIALVSILYKFGLLGQLIMSGLFVFYLDRTIQVMRHYKKDNITMIELDSQVFPDNPRVWYYRYEHMLHKGNPVMAWAEATYGLKHLPDDCQLWFGLACASFELGDMNAALEFVKTSERFMLLVERKNMQSLIAELKGRINKVLADKWKKGIV